jgi:hypothetical protein
MFMYFNANLNKSFNLSSYLFSASNLKNLFLGKIFHNRLTSFLMCAAFLLCFAQNGWGQIAQRGSATTSSAGTANNTSLTINKPTGVTTGDVMLLTIVQNETDNDNGGLASPSLSGWTIVKDGIIRSNGISNGDNLWFGTVYYRISDGTEGTSFSLAMHARCDMAIGSIVAFSGVATNALKPDGTSGGPFDVVPSTFNDANAATAAATDVNVASNNSAVVIIAMVNNDRTYSGWSNSRSELFDNTTTTGDDASVGAAWSSCVTSGATGNGTVTLSSSDYNSALLLVLRSTSITSAGTASSAPTLCANTTLTNITHTTSGTAGIGTAMGLPSGVSASWAANTITISGTPSASGTFNYTIPLTGGCVSASGTIIVTPSPSALTAITSSSTICANASVNLASTAASNNTVSTIAFNGFESVDDWAYTNNTSSGISISTSFVRTGSNSLRFKGSNDNNIDPSITFNTVSLLGYSNVQLSVAFAALDVDTDDDLWLDISYDNGVNWSSTKLIDGWGNFGNGWNTTNTINTTSGVVVNANPYVLNIPGSETQIAVRIRFNESANDNRNDYYYIDDISISGTPIPAFAWTSNPSGFTSSIQNPTVTPTATTIYTVTATNAYGCSASANATVTVNALPTATITAGSITTFCQGGSVVLTASAGSSYLWSNGATTQSITVSTSGSYSVSITNASGCSRTSTATSVTVNQPSVAPTSITGTTSICTGSSTTLTANGGTAGYEAEYIWYPTACPTDGYTQEWTSQPFGLINTTQNSLNNGILSVVSTSGDPMIDMSSLGSFNPSIYRYVNVRYKVTSGAAGIMEIFFYNPSHNYAVAGESRTRMLVSDNTWRTASFDMWQDAQYTTGGNIQGWRFDWAGASGVSMDIDFISLSTQPILGSGSTLIVTPSSTTSYFVNYKGSCNTTVCASTTVIVNPIVTPTFTQVSAICSGATLNALPTTSSNNITGTWSPALNNTATATYTFTPTAGQCASTTTMTITVNALPTATISAGSATTFCQGGSVVLTASVGSSSLWSNGATTQSITASTAGSYSVTVTNASGCSAASVGTTVSVSQPTLVTTPVSGDMIWKGAASEDWATLTNWWQYIGGVYTNATAAPTTAQNVIIPKNQTCVLNQPNTFANSGNANNLTIETDATLTLQNGTLVVKGNWINNGIFDAGSGTVLFNGTTTQTIGGTSQTAFNNLTLNNNHTGVYPSHVALKLLEDATITKTLTLTDGIIDVFDKILTLGTSIQKVIISPSLGTADSYIAAHHNLGNTGYVKQFVHASNIGNGEQYYFPIGDDGKWTPYTLSFNSGTSIAAGSTITSHVNDAMIPGSANAAFSNRIKRDWEVDPSVGITNPNYNVQIYHNNDVLESGATAAANIIPFKKHGSALFGPVGAFNSPQITQVGTYTASSNSYTWSGITSFSNFGGTAGTISGLPIELISFQANCTGNKQVDVTWSTASEYNTSHFLVEKSRDGVSWATFSTLAAAGNSTSIIDYALTDTDVANGTSYYRLTQFDTDGASETFNIASVNCGSAAVTSNLVTYPNPSNGSFYLDFYTQDLTGPSSIAVFDSRGVIVYRQDVLVEKGSNVFHIEDLDAAPGMYYIQVSNGTTTSYIVKHSLR